MLKKIDLARIRLALIRLVFLLSILLSSACEMNRDQRSMAIGALESYLDKKN